MEILGFILQTSQITVEKGCMQTMTLDGLHYLMFDAEHNELFSVFQKIKRDVWQIDFPPMAGYLNATDSDVNVFFKEQIEQMFISVQAQKFNSNKIWSKGNIL